MPLIYDSDSDTENVGKRNIAKVARQMMKEGYSDGITAGHESTFQKSFDEGYARALEKYFNTYMLKEIVENYKSFESKLPTEIIDCLIEVEKSPIWTTLDETPNTTPLLIDAVTRKNIDKIKNFFT